MKKLIAVAGAVALAACGGSEVDEPAEAEIVETAEDTAAAESAAGTYTMEDGVVVTRIELADDGTFTVSENDAAMESGTWTDSDNGVCLTGEDAEEACFTRTVGDDGAVTMTDADGEASVWAYES